MDKKYQVFVSSTYTDLIDERQAALKVVMNLGHIATGMEGFFAADEDQFEYIKRIIDQCDYYILIIAGRYGSLHPDTGTSFTEMEYEYAVSKGITVLPFLHRDVSSLPSSKVDGDSAIVARLEAFKQRVTLRRMASFWTSQDELQLAIMGSLSQAMNETPGVGWVRGNVAASADILTQLNEVRNALDQATKDNEFLRAQLQPNVKGIATLTELFPIRYRYIRKSRDRSYPENGDLLISWAEIVKIIGPPFFSPGQLLTLEFALKQYISNKHSVLWLDSLEINAADRNTIKIQMAAYGFMRIYSALATNGAMAEFMELTEFGKKALIELTAVRSAYLPADAPSPPNPTSPVSN